MKNGTHQQDMIDAMDDQTEELSRLADATENAKNVIVPAPTVNVSPIIQPAVVTVTHAKGWVFEITERMGGAIKKFTATPIQ